MTTAQNIEIIDDEWHYYASGHVDPTAFLDACERYEIECEVYTREEVATESVKAYYEPSAVQHVWYVDAEDPQNDELMRQCEPDTPGAQPFTIVPTP